MKLAILNTSIVTSDGTYSLITINKSVAIHLAVYAMEHEGIDSAVGHFAAAELLTRLLQVEVRMNRQMFAQEIGQKALVFKLLGRLPEGKVLTLEEIDEIGYEFKLLTRIS